MNDSAPNHGNRSVDGVGPAPATMARRAQAWLRRQRQAQRLWSMDPRERRRMAGELGVGPVDLGQAVTADRDDPLLLGEMMQRFGVDAAGLPTRTRGALRDMERVCASCPSKRRCVRALAAGSTAAECRAFCPNAPTLDSLVPASTGGCRGSSRRCPLCTRAVR